MRFVEVPSFENVADALRRQKSSSMRLHARLELYATGSLVGQDKRTQRQVEDSLTAEFDRPEMSGSLTKTALGDLHHARNRKLLVNLVCMLNASVPDFDFVTTRGESFRKEASAATVAAVVNQHLAELPGGAGSVISSRLWQAISEQITLPEAQVYSFASDSDGDPFVGAGTIWSFGYFFVHNKTKRIVYLSCTAASQYASTPIGFRGSRVDERASPPAIAPAAAAMMASNRLAPDHDASVSSSSSSSSSGAAAASGFGAGDLSAPPLVAAGDASVSAGASLARPARTLTALRSVSGATAITMPGGASPWGGSQSGFASLLAGGGGGSAGGTDQPTLAVGLPLTPGGAPSAAALLFAGGSASGYASASSSSSSASAVTVPSLGEQAGRAAPAGVVLAAEWEDDDEPEDADEDEGGEPLHGMLGMERQQSATAPDDDDDDDAMSGDGDGPKYARDAGDDVDGFHFSQPAASPQGGDLFDWDDGDA